MTLYADPSEQPEAYDQITIGGLSTFALAGLLRIRVEGFARKNDYDIKVGKGTAGATETLKGQPPAEGTITIWTWTAAQRRALGPFFSRLKYKPSKQGTASSPASPAATSSGFKSAAADSDNERPEPKIPAPGNTSGKTKDASDDKADKTKDPPALTKADALEVVYPTLADNEVSYILPPQELGMWEPEGDDYSYMKRVIKCVEFTQPPAANIAATPTGASDKAPKNGFVQGAGGQEPAAPSAGATQQKSAGKDAQGAWGGP